MAKKSDAPAEIKTITLTMSRRVEGAARDIGEAMDALRGGDLTRVPRVRGNDELAFIARSLGEAVRQLRDDLQAIAVITDRTMPGMSGETLARSLHEIRSDIPIVMSSGYEGDLRNTDLAKTGIQALLPKPFQASDLAIVLRRILKR